MTAQATDAYSNNVTGTWSLTLSSSDPAVSFIPSSVLTNSSGQGTFTATLNTTGLQTITVNSSGHTGSATFNVNKDLGSGVGPLTPRGDDVVKAVEDAMPNKMPKTWKKR